MYVQIDYENEKSVVLEGLGPNTIIGAVADVIFEHYTESSDGDKLQRIHIGNSLVNSGIQVS